MRPVLLGEPPHPPARDTHSITTEESTTPALAELARRQLEAVNRRDLDALASYVAPDVVYDTTPSGLGLYEGAEAVGAFLEEYWGAFEELNFALEEFLDLGAGVTLSVIRQDARPAGSAAHIQAREAHITEWVGETVVRATVYVDIDEARAVAERLAKERGQAMSRQNVAVVRSALDASNGGDLDALMAALDPSIEWMPVESDPDYVLHRGHDDVRAWLVSWAEVFPDMRWEAECFLDAGGDVVVTLGRVCGRGGASGADTESQVYGIVFTVRSGKIVRVEESERESALEAVGLQHKDDAATREVADWLRSGYERGSRDKAPPVDWWHPEGEYVNAREDPDHATYRGIGAITKLFASWFEAYPDIRVEPLEVRVVGERVFAWTRYSGHAATSGLPFEMELANVMTVEHGKIRRLEEYMDRAEALEVLGRTE